MKPLIGTEKQIAWASDIRNKKIASLDRLAESLPKLMAPASAEKSIQIINHIKNIVDAGVWIVLRDQPMDNVNWLVEIYKQYKKTGEIVIWGQKNDCYVIATKTDFNF